jgi:hypothetical protein
VLKKFQDKGIKISRNVSCYSCGLQFDPNDLLEYFDMKFIYHQVTNNVEKMQLFDLKHCERSDMAIYNISDQEKLFISENNFCPDIK